MTIRLMEMNDYNAVHALWMTVFPENTDASYDRDPIERFLKRNPGCSFVAETGNEVVGVILAGHDGRRGYIYHLGVLPSHRSKGIGRELLTAAERALTEQGIERAQLMVLQTNSGAQRFYRREGYEHRHHLQVYSKLIS